LNRRHDLVGAVRPHVRRVQEVERDAERPYSCLWSSFRRLFPFKLVLKESSGRELLTMSALDNERTEAFTDLNLACRGVPFRPAEGAIRLPSWIHDVLSFATLV